VRTRGDAIGPDSPPDDFHGLRIRCKRLRYAVEFLSPLAPNESEAMIRRLVAVQDCLGEHQDAQVAMQRLRAMAEEDLPARAVFLLGRIDERYERQAEALRGEFPEVYAGIRGKAWDNLRRVLDGRRRAALAALPTPRVPPLRTAPSPKGAPTARAAATSTPAAPPGLTVVRD
jgi:hypothetical protein